MWENGELLMSRAVLSSVAVLILIAGLNAAPEADAEKLVQRLGDPSFRVREAASRALVKLGKQAVPALRAALESDDLEIRMRARQALQAIQTSIEYLLEELKSGNAKAQIEAADVLAQLGDKGKPAIPGLVKLLEHKEEAVRGAAASALASIDPENKVLEKVIPAKAHCNGRYTKLLRKVHVPQDRGSYGDFHEFGHYQATDWQGHKNIPAGFWVYVYPHWYIWGEAKEAPIKQIPAAAINRNPPPPPVGR
jgi:hypothetical protein